MPMFFNLLRCLLLVVATSVYGCAQTFCNKLSDLFSSDPRSEKCVDLSGKNLKSLQSHNLKNAEYVSLAFNRVKDVSSLFGLSLKYLDVSYTAITEFPIDFCDLRNLERIDGDGMMISYPDCFCSPSIKVINGDYIQTRPEQNWQDCTSLKNAHFNLPDDSSAASRILDKISSMPSLERLGLHNCRLDLPMNLNQFDKINSLEIAVNSDVQFERAIERLSSWKSLKTLSISVPKGMTIPGSISKMTNIDILAIQTFSGGLVTLPPEVKSLKLKKLYLSKNMKEILSDERTCILYRGTPNINYYKKHGYCLEWFSDPIRIQKL